MKSKTPVYAALCLAVIAGVVGLVMALGGGDEKSASNAKATVSKDAALRYPNSWQTLDKKALAQAGAKPLAAIQRKDKSGIVVVRAEAPRKTSYQQLAKDLNAELKNRFKDFKPVTQRLIKTRAGESLYFSYIRKKQGTAQSITLTKVGGRNYSINTVVRGGSKAAAREAGAIIRSFGPATR